MNSKSVRRGEFEDAFRHLCEQASDRLGLRLLYTLRSPALPGLPPTYKAVVSDGETAPREVLLGSEQAALLNEMERYVATGEATARVAEYLREADHGLALAGERPHSRSRAAVA